MPGVSSGTRTMLCCACERASRSVLPITIETLQRSRPAPVLHHLRPLITKLSPSRSIETSIERDGDNFVINGRKWWSTGAGRERCRVSIVMGKTDLEARSHAQQSMVLVPLDTPGITYVRSLR